ncbi:GrpB family protein [Streptomyces venetus]|uniref:GrpB family protein n=1 Tax=Streptomyces venetus TaxID=1701086 RepID=UPI003C2DF669
MASWAKETWLCLKIEHTGSTAVPGLAAKPVADRWPPSTTSRTLHPSGGARRRRLPPPTTTG